MLIYVNICEELSMFTCHYAVLAAHLFTVEDYIINHRDLSFLFLQTLQPFCMMSKQRNPAGSFSRKVSEQLN